jgi:hypothetical protein
MVSEGVTLLTIMEISVLWLYYFRSLNDTGTTHFITQMLYILPSQCMIFMWFSQWTVIISLNSINWLVLVMEMYCVLPYIRPEFLYIILQSLQLVPWLGWLSPASDHMIIWFECGLVCMRFVVDKVALGQFFFFFTASVFPMQYKP